MRIRTFRELRPNTGTVDGRAATLKIKSYLLRKFITDVYLNNNMWHGFLFFAIEQINKWINKNEIAIGW